ncbi:MAG: hypothetical protein VX642_15140 [Bdellovibrionota bacterium]|nr:hypothetical protein [Bdellovibrionota bacterium]
MKPVLELILDLGFRKIEDVAGNITNDIQQSLNESFRKLSALSFLALVMAISFVALVASTYQWALTVNGIAVGPLQWILLSAVLLVIAGLSFVIIDRKITNIKKEQSKQNEQWIEIGNLVLSFAKDLYNNQKLEQEISQLKQELRETRPHDFKIRYEETTTSNQQL